MKEPSFQEDLFFTESERDFQKPRLEGPGHCARHVHLQAARHRWCQLKWNLDDSDDDNDDNDNDENDNDDYDNDDYNDDDYDDDIDDDVGQRVERRSSTTLNF